LDYNPRSKLIFRFFEKFYELGIELLRQASLGRRPLPPWVVKPSDSWVNLSLLQEGFSSKTHVEIPLLLTEESLGTRAVGV
jgi:hypothetical protein